MSNVIFLSDGYEAGLCSGSSKQEQDSKIHVLQLNEDIGDIDLYFTKQDLLDMLNLLEEQEKK